MTHPQTPQEEEEFLLDKLLSARHALETHKSENTARRIQQNMLEKHLEDAEQAVIDYALSNGLTQFEVLGCSVTLGKSDSLEVTDISAIPEEFLRVRTTMEVDKILITRMIRAGILQANWATIKPSYKITVRSK